MRVFHVIMQNEVHGDSLGERENPPPAWVEIHARDIFQRGGSTLRFLKGREKLRPRWVETDALENSQDGKSDPLSPEEREADFRRDGGLSIQ
jgi:hypothetical protein